MKEDNSNEREREKESCVHSGERRILCNCVLCMIAVAERLYEV